MRLVGTTIALALALLAQHRLAHDAPTREVVALFLVAAGLAIRYFPGWETKPFNSRPAADDKAVAGEGGAALRTRRRGRRWLLGLTWPAAAAAMVLAAFGTGWPWDGLLWGLSLLTFLAALSDRRWWRSLRWFTGWEALALAAVLVLALFTRVYHLDRLPPSIHGDEAQFGLNARAILHGEQPTLFAVGWYQFPVASFAAQAGVMRFFGDDVAGLRLSSALFGALTLLPVYLLARSMFDRRVALAAAALMAVGHWPVHFSRLGINNIQTTFFAAWAVYLAWRALGTGHRLDYALTGLALGLGLYTYYAARLMPLVVGAILMVALAGQDANAPEDRAHSLAARLLRVYFHLEPRANESLLRNISASGLVALAAAGLLTIAPQLVYFARHPEPLVARQRGVFVFNNLPHLESVYHTRDWGQILRAQTTKSLLVFNARGDSSGQYGFQEPMLDQVTAGLMVVGLAVSLWRWRRGGHWVLHLWFWPHLLVGSVLTIDAPFVPRLVGLMPVPFIWAGMVLGGWWRLVAEWLGGFQNRRVGWVIKPSYIPALALLILAGWANYDAYINRYIRQHRATTDASRAAHLLATLPPDTQVYLMGAHNIYAGFGTFRFVAPDALVWDAVNVTDWAPVRQADPLDTMFLVWRSHMDRLPYLLGVYPEGEYQSYFDQYGNLMFATYLVPAEIIRGHQRLMIRKDPPSEREEGRSEGARSPDSSPQSLSPIEEDTRNGVWSGTLWLPDDGPRQFCPSYGGGDSGSGAFLQIDGTRFEAPGAGGACYDDPLTLDLSAGPHFVQVRMALRGEAEAIPLHWRRGDDAWEEVPRHLLWDQVWPGGLLGAFAREGEVIRREVAPLIAYRDFVRELVGPVHATWNGCLITDRPGEYEFRLRSFDGARLTLDGQTLIQDDHRGALGEEVARASLDAGRYSIQLEALFSDGPRWLEWYWRLPGGGWALVPPEVLKHGPGCGEESGN